MSNDERTDHSVSSQPSSSKSGSGLSNSRPNYSLNNQNSPWFLKKQVSFDFTRVYYVIFLSSGFGHCSPNELAEVENLEVGIIET